MSETFDFNGNLEVGDDLVIDAETMEISKGNEFNRVEDYKNFDGDLISLAAGDNTITYTDSETSRTIEIEVIREDRYV